MIKPDHNIEFLKSLTFEPLTQKNWNKFVELFGNKGACGNCWTFYCSGRVIRTPPTPLIP